MGGGGSKKEKEKEKEKRNGEFKVFQRDIKVVVVGDGAVGKTSLLISATTGCFPEKYVPTAMEHAVLPYKTKEGQDLKIGFWDTTGSEGYERLRPLSYPGADVVLILFSIVNPSSFENVIAKWVPEVQHYIPKVPCIFVGTKLDLRDDEKTRDMLLQKKMWPLTEEQGERLAKGVGAASYVETSALRGEGLELLFEEICHVGLLKYPPLPLRHISARSLLSPPPVGLTVKKAKR